VSTVLTSQQKEAVVANLPLVEHIVNRVCATLPATFSRDDLVQTGIMGLISATMRYDPEHGAAFSTFAGRRIEGEVIDMLRRQDWAPRSVRSLQRRFKQAEGELATADRGHAQGNPSTQITARIAADLGVEIDDLNRLRHDINKARIDSLDRPVRTVSDDSGAPVPLSSSLLADETSLEQQIDDQELRGYLRAGVSYLPERHRIVIVGFFFEGRSMTELGEFLGVSQSRASQLKDEALKLLRSALEQVYEGENNEQDPGLTRRQQTFNETVATGKDWKERLDTGKGISVVG